jgi:asparagine synthase (glutamine-hydrolysing)
VVNGELYYESELRSRLEKTYSFSSASDSEMAIALYKRYGTDFLEHLRGEFSLVLYDGKTQKLVVARDRLGVKPLHYGVFDGRLLVATQCKGIVELLQNKDQVRWDVKCVAQGGGHYSNRTFFEGIKKVPPGHVLVVHQNSIDQLEFTPYWRTRYPENSGNTDNRPTEELIEALRTELLKAVRLRLVSSDVSIGVLLSGGVDSSAIAGMAADMAKHRTEGDNSTTLQLPTCFTIGFPDDGDLDESAIAARTAANLGLPFEKVVVTEQMLADELEESVWLGEALLWDLQHVAKKVMSRHISSRGLKVVLNGDGSDELFGGYSFFASDRLLADDEYRATSFQQATTEQRKSAQRKHAGSANWFGAETALDEEQSPYAKALGLPSAFSKLAVTIHHDWLPQELRELGDPFEAIHEMFTPKEIEEMAKLHPMHRGMWAWQKTMLPNVVIASISDGAEMGEYFHHWLLSYGGKLTKENKHILSKVDHHSLTTSLLSSRRLSHQTR